MTGSVLLDVVLVLILISFLVYGFRAGFTRSLAGILGFVLGGILAFFLAPFVGAWVTDPAWRIPATLGATLLLVFGGLSLGATVGVAISRRLPRGPLRAVDRLVGAALTVIATALVISILAFSVGTLGIPFLAPAIAASTVVRTIDSLTPDPAKAFIARARALAVQDGIPRIIQAFTGPTPEIPADTPTSPGLTAAASSVVRITGTAYSCGQNQSGSGFVAAEDRIITNAHVVAGVVEPVVQTPGGQALPGRIVYFDPVDDLAVIRVDGLTAAALEPTADLPRGTTAVTQGYPFGGPFDADPAVVVSVGPQLVADIYGRSPAERQVYTLASEVQSGESGGPLLSVDGRVAGVVFAKGVDSENLGYAVAMADVQPVISAAAGLVEPVSSGSCV